MQAEITLRQAAQQALKSMDDHMYRADTHEFYEAKEALRAALAEPEQAQRWAVFCAGCRKEWSVPYQHPGKSVCADCEAQLKAEPEQEPYTWRKVTYDQLMEEVRNRGHEIRNAKITAPTPRKPLTDEQISRIWGSYLSRGLEFARAIEAAHGIGEQHE